MADDPAVGTVETLYLCNFRVSVDGDWLCLKELQDVELGRPPPADTRLPSPGYDGTACSIHRTATRGRFSKLSGLRKIIRSAETLVVVD